MVPGHRCRNTGRSTSHHSTSPAMTAVAVLGLSGSSSEASSSVRPRSSSSWALARRRRSLLRPSSTHIALTRPHGKRIGRSLLQKGRVKIRGDDRPPTRQIGLFAITQGSDMGNRAQRRSADFRRFAWTVALSASACERKSRAQAQISLDYPRCPKSERLVGGPSWI